MPHTPPRQDRVTPERFPSVHGLFPTVDPISNHCGTLIHVRNRSCDVGPNRFRRDVLHLPCVVGTVFSNDGATA